jgi:hypothetical protein
MKKGRKKKKLIRRRGKNKKNQLFIFIIFLFQIKGRGELIVETNTLFKLDYSEQFYPNQSFARFETPGVMAQRLISKD